jgi:hypothetical protein
MVTYCGNYTTYEENGYQFLSTAVDVSLDPNWIGTAQVRRWEYKKEGAKESLTLRPVQEFDLPVSIII